MGLGNHLHSLEGVDNSQQKIKNACYLALAVSFILLAVKLTVWYLTNSLTFKTSALDSLMDIGISFANFFIVRLTQGKQNPKFPFGYDKLSALAALAQVLFLGFISIYVVMEGMEKLMNPEPLVYHPMGIPILIFSMLTTLFLVLYQGMVVRATGSLIVRADMLHYKTDLFVNFGAFVALIFMWNYEIQYLDALIGIIAAIYIVFASLSLGLSSILILLDMSDIEAASKIHSLLEQENIESRKEDIIVRFSGTKNIIDVKLIYQENEAETMKQKCLRAKQALQNDYKNAIINISPECD